MDTINLNLINNTNYDQYFKNASFYDHILHKFADMTQTNIDTNCMNLCIMLISKYTNDYDSIMISINNALNFKINHKSPHDIILYANCVNLNYVAEYKYPNEMPKYMLAFFNDFINDKCSGIHEDARYWITLSFENTEKVIEFYEDYQNDNKNDNPNDDIYNELYVLGFDNYKLMHTYNRDKIFESYPNLIPNPQNGKCNYVPLEFKFDYFIGG